MTPFLLIIDTYLYIPKYINSTCPVYMSLVCIWHVYMVWGGVEAREWHWVSPITIYLLHWSRVSHWIQSLQIWRVESSLLWWPLASQQLVLKTANPIHLAFIWCLNLNTGPSISEASCSPTEPSPESCPLCFWNMVYMSLSLNFQCIWGWLWTSEPPIPPLECWVTGVNLHGTFMQWMGCNLGPCMRCVNTLPTEPHSQPCRKHSLGTKVQVDHKETEVEVKKRKSAWCKHWSKDSYSEC